MRYTSILLALSLIAGTSALVGCDDEISRREEVEVKDNGTVKRETETVKEKPDGTIVKEETKERTRTDDR